jgi:phosphate:Na+ symporter
MAFSVDIWKMVAGVAIFLLGMNFLEEGLKGLAARSFKLFLKRNTSNKPKALLAGAIVTAVLQSSSIVNLMVLAFVESGIILMQNALTIMLGANLGATFTSWILATAGFRVNIENLALPLAGVSGIIMMLIRQDNNLKYWSKLIFGFSFLFVGLGYVKTGMENAIQGMDLSLLSGQPAFIFLLTGLVITSIIQSSSATVAIVLSALNLNAIDLYSASAIVLGAEIGTTLKLMLASANGSAIKKRVAFGNLLFNISVSGIVLILLSPINHFITDTLDVRDHLIALVSFQSLVNISGILLFYPFLGAFSHFLERRFTERENGSRFINKQLSEDMDLALQALEKESRNFMNHVLDFITDVLALDSIEYRERVRKSFQKSSALEKYNYIKRMHGEIHNFYIHVQHSSSSGPETERLDQLISSVRNWMYAAKNIRDALMDIDQLKKSSNDTKYNYYLISRRKIKEFLIEINRVMQSDNRDSRFEDITGLHQLVQKGYTESLQELYRGTVAEHLNELEISTFINFNREIYTAFKSMVFALKEYLLNSREAAYFDELPGFIR